ncbi:MAG: hypothetical protein IK083_02330 [Abditibacteriota bacterium]|nr:hypothetical protein [Abditibacteriota bacterium]
MMRNLLNSLILVLVIAGVFASAVPSYADVDDYKINREYLTVKANGTTINLAMGGILADTENVYLNGVPLSKSKYEYTIDYATSVLTFSKKLEKGDFVSVDYYYKPGVAKSAAVTSATLPFLDFSGGNNSLSMALGFNTTDAMTGDMTYGTNIKSSLGGILSFNSYYYNNTLNNTDAQRSGDFNVHNLTLNLGKSGSITAGYQEIDSTFAGDAYLAANSGIDGSLLGQMLAEKGLKRNNLGLNYSFNNLGSLSMAYSSVKDANDKVESTAIGFNNDRMQFSYSKNSYGGAFARYDSLREADKGAMKAEAGLDRTAMAFNYKFVNFADLAYADNKISNNGKDISNRTLSLAGAKFQLDYLSRSIDEGFGRYGSLREGDKGQYSLEDGMKRTGLSLKYNTSTAEAPLWQTFYMSKLRQNGASLDTSMVNLAYKNLEMGYASVSSKGDFNRMYALDANEKNRLTGYVKKMFDYNTDMNSVSDQDRASWNNMSGLDRSLIYSKYVLSPDSALTFAKSTIRDKSAGNAGLDMINLGYNNKTYKLWYRKDDIDSEFRRLYALTPQEIGGYNNQYGMRRSVYGLETTTKLGYFRYSDDSIYDSVTGSGYKRNYFNYASPKVSFARRYMDFDDAFTRVLDLYDADRANQQANKGFKRTEYDLNLKMGKTNQTLDVNAYLVDAKKAVTDQDIGKLLYDVTYKPNDKFNAYWFSNDYTESAGGVNFVDNKTKIARMNKILDLGKFKNISFYSQYYTNSYLDGNRRPIDQEILDVSLKSDQSQKFVLNLDYQSNDFDHGASAFTKYDLYAHQKITDKIALTFGYGVTDYNTIQDENRLKYGVIYSVNDNFAVNYSVDQKLGGDGNDTDVQYLTVTGKLPRLFSDKFVKDMAVNYKYDTKKVKLINDKYDAGYSFTADLLNGKFLMERSNILEANHKSYYIENEKLSYVNEKVFGTPISVKYEDNTTTQTNGVRGDTDRLNMSYALNDKLSALYNKVDGNWTDQKSFIPVKTKEFGLTHKLNAYNDLTLKYTFNNLNNANQLTKSEEVLKFGLSGTRKDREGKWTIEGGITTDRRNMDEDEVDFSYNVSYERKISSDGFLGISASKATALVNGVQQTNLQPENVMLNFRTSF